MLFLVGRCWLAGRPIPRPPGVLAPHAPVQNDLADGPVFELAGHRLRALAEFHLEARVLAKERYRYDRGARLSPVDLALGWGPLSSTPVIEALDIEQHGRFYFWSAAQLPLEPQQITLHSANIHMIPADDAVRDVLLAARPGHLAEIDGYLVEVSGDDGFRWRSSTSRADAGGGACEVVYVEAISLR